jgi:hypothetical protein
MICPMKPLIGLVRLVRRCLLAYLGLALADH